MDEFMQTQKNALGINNFLQNAQNYTKENFPDLDMENLFSSAITGNLGTNFWTNTILNFAGSKNCHSTHDNSFSSYYYSQHFQSDCRKFGK